MDDTSRQPQSAQPILRQPAELRHAAELARLVAEDHGPIPPGWRMSARAVRRFLVGGEGIERKFVGDDALIDRCVVDLLGDRGLMLVGEPGTAKSMLSELLAAAVCGDSTLVVQGSAGTVEDHVTYSWNYALLLAEGPSPRALVPSPVMTAMRRGAIVRIEEITRCPQDIQDCLIGILSEKMIAVAELGGIGIVQARRGFNVIGTANLRDRGVHEMSSALKRRFNFETVHPIRDRAFEVALVRRQAEALLAEAGTPGRLERDVVEVLVDVFHDLRSGVSGDGVKIEPTSAVMSTAEAVSVAVAAGLDAHYLTGAPAGGGEIARHLRGTVLKDDPDDLRRFRHYVQVVVRRRADRDARWAAFLREAQGLA
jgi:MoxR-like ATPase